MERAAHQLFPVTVTAVQDLSPIMRRLTLSAPELGDYAPLGPDEFFGLVMPPEGHDLPELPQDPDRATPRGAFGDLPEEARPEARWYTLRAHRPALGEVDVDVVAHGDAGPGSSWVLRAEVDAVAGFQTGTAAYRTGGATGPQVIAGDETAAPAISRILEVLPEGVEAHVFLEVPTVGDVPDLPHPAGATITVIERGTHAPGSALISAVEAADLPIPTGSWLAGEQKTVAGVRRHLVGTLGAEKRSIYHCAYWILGRARG
nr:MULTISPECIES: siderophore-interacting protein [unclassified Ornithinimicrobium]